ncbi:MAG: SDR family oxidoreductase, partial [Deltaproteobacteria bacterium]|nr:SDR family oxidoreductase [Deltaproteobacteria bacterium]
MGRVEGKVAVVTGGAEGLGRATSLLLAREGAKIAVTDINDAAGQAVAEEIKAVGGTARFWHLEVTSEAQVKDVFAEVAGAFGDITVLVNNAGVCDLPSTPTHELSAERWDKVIDVNVKGVFLCTKHVIPYMKRAGVGSIIDISSVYGLVGAANTPAYHASKGAVRLMAKTDALFYAPEKSRVNSVHPGFIWTSMVKDSLRTAGISEEDGRGLVGSLHPVGHPGEPIDVAYGVLYLASDESKFVTG